MASNPARPIQTHKEIDPMNTTLKNEVTQTTDDFFEHACYHWDACYVDEEAQSESVAYMLSIGKGYIETYQDVCLNGWRV